MKKIFLATIILLSFLTTLKAQIQGTYQIKGADTVKMWKPGGATELQVQNATQGVKGFLFNLGNGITIFQRGAIKVNDSTYIVGADTIHIKTNLTSVSGAAGSNMQVQFNSSGNFSASAGFYFDSLNNNLNLGTLNTFTGATNSFINGVSNTAKAYSFISGNSNLNIAGYANSLGIGLINTFPNSVVIGSYNDTTRWSNANTSLRQDTLPVFLVGNGGGNGTRSNTLAIIRNGKIIFNFHNNSTLDSALAVDQNGVLIQRKFSTSGGGSGITAVSLIMPPGFNISGSPVTGTGGTFIVSLPLSNGVLQLVAGGVVSGPVADSIITNLNWSKIFNTPTTVTGYGITNAVRSDLTYVNPSWITSLPWSKITSTPTTLAGYGITDPIVLTSGSYANPSWITSLAWSKITGTPTTLGGYGITDATPSSRNLTINNVTQNLTADRSWFVTGISADSIKKLPVDTSADHQGYVLAFDSTNHKWYLAPNGSGTSGVSSVAVSSTDLSVSGSPIVSSGTFVLNINNAAVTYAKIQNVTSQRLLGRYAGTNGVTQEISIGAGLALNSGTGVLSSTITQGVTQVTSGNLSPLFTTVVNTNTTTPAFVFTLSNSNAWTIFGNNTNASAQPAYFTPTLTNGLFAGEGSNIHQTLHANPSGNLSFGLVDLTSDVANILPIASGGNGTATPSIVHGLGISVTGSWGNYIIAADTSSNIFKDTITLKYHGLGDSLMYGTGGDTLNSFKITDSANFHHYFKSDGTLLLYASTAGGTPSGSNSQIQYNNSGAFGAYSDFTINSATNALCLGCNVSTDNATFTLGGSGTGVGTIQTSGGDLNIIGDTVAIKSTSPGILRFYTNSVERLRLDNSGNLFMLTATLQSLDSTNWKILVRNASTGQVQPMSWPTFGSGGGTGTPAGAFGDIQIAGTSGFSTAPSSLFHYDSTNIRLGVNNATPSGRAEFTTNAIGATVPTQAQSVVISDNDIATNGNQRFSPGLILLASGYATTPAAGRIVGFMQELETQQGTAAPTGTWTWRASINGGAYNLVGLVNTAGTMFMNSGGNAGQVTYGVGGVATKGLWGPTGNFVNIATNGTDVVQFSSGAGIVMGNPYVIGFSASTAPGTTAPDIALARNGPGVLEVNTGAIGAFANLKISALSGNTSNNVLVIGADSMIRQVPFPNNGLTRQSITTGTFGTVTGGNYIVTFNPASVIASYNLTLPASPADLQVVEIEAGGTIGNNSAVVTALTISPNSGQSIEQAAAPTTINGGEFIMYRWNASTAKWYRENGMNDWIVLGLIVSIVVSQIKRKKKYNVAA